MKKPTRKKRTGKRQPSTNGLNGDAIRGSNGRFLPGNPGGPGNPHGRQVAELRSVLLGAITPEDIQAAVGKLVEMSRDGNLSAIRELLDRVLGKANQPIEQTIHENFNGMSDTEVTTEAIKVLLSEAEQTEMLLEAMRNRGYRVTPPKEQVTG